MFEHDRMNEEAIIDLGGLRFKESARNDGWKLSRSNIDRRRSGLKGLFGMCAGLRYEFQRQNYAEKPASAKRNARVEYPRRYPSQIRSKAFLHVGHIGREELFLILKGSLSLQYTANTCLVSVFVAERGPRSSGIATAFLPQRHEERRGANQVERTLKTAKISLCLSVALW
jgi:hypothetical protein